MTCASGTMNSSLVHEKPRQSHFSPSSRWQCYISGWQTNSVCSTYRHMKPTEKNLQMKNHSQVLVNCLLIHTVGCNAVQKIEYSIWNDNCIIVTWSHCVACLIQRVSSSSHQKFHFKSNSSLSEGAECAYFCQRWKTRCFWMYCIVWNTMCALFSTTATYILANVAIHSSIQCIQKSCMLGTVYRLKMLHIWWLLLFIDKHFVFFYVCLNNCMHK